MPLKIDVYNEQNGINQYTLSNGTGGLIVKIIDYGAIITNILVKDKSGAQKDVVLGWDDLDVYLGKRGENPYFGASIGRCANRITNGKFSLNGKTYQLPLNGTGGHSSLHGGYKGFDKRKWNIITETESSITLQLTSEDGEEGYPGKLNVELTYSVIEANELRLDYSAKLEENQSIETIVNLTNHSYFNLNGCTNEQELDVLNHTVLMKCENYLEVNDLLQPTGKMLSVKTDSPVMDFTRSHSIGERINKVLPNGYDHCYVIETNEHNFNIKGNDTVREAVVVVTSPLTGIKLTLSTTEPAVQFYSGNFLDGKQQKTKKDQSSKGLLIPKHGGFCLEAQRFPNAINDDKWQKQVILKDQQIYKQITSYKFDV